MNANRILPLLVGLAACASAPVSPEYPDVTQWRQLGTPVWQFEDDVISSGPYDNGAFLVSNVEYSDFRLSIEFWVEDNTNSGVFIRCLNPADVPDVNPDSCYEINIWDNHPVQDFRSGSIVKHVVPTAHVDTLNQWNQLVVDVRGATISVVMNNMLTAVMTNAERSAGVIALQYAGDNRLKFRHLIIEPL